MMTKVRGGKGFDALFSRFFDEPELKAAVDSLHDNFSATEDDLPAEAPTAPAGAKPRAPAAVKKQAAVPVTPPPAIKKKVVTPPAAPAATKKQVVTSKKQSSAPVVEAKPSVSHKAAIAKKEAVPDEPVETPSQDLDQKQLAELEVISSSLTVGWSVELLDELADELEIEPADDQEHEQLLDQLPVIDVDETDLVDAVEDEVQDAFVEEDDEAQDAAGDAVAHVQVDVQGGVHDADDDDEDLQFEDFFSRKSKSSLSPAIATAAEPEAVVIPAAPAVVEPEPVAALIALEDAEPESIAIPVAPTPVVSEVVVTPVVHSVTRPEAVAAPVTITPSLPVVPTTSIDDDDDDQLIEDFFSQKGQMSSRATVHTPAVAPFVVQQPADIVSLATPGVKITPQAAPTPVVIPVHAVKKEIPLPEIVPVPAEKSLSQILVHPQMQCEDLSTQARRRPLTKDQGRILLYLFESARGCSNVESISGELGIDSHSVRESLLALVTEGYLYLLDKKRDSRINPAGFSYRMNNYLCSRYAARLRGGGDVPQDQLMHDSIWQTPTSGLSIPQPVIFGSSVAKEKEAPVVKKEQETPAAQNEKETVAVKTVLHGAVGTYWQKEGLEDALVLKWCSTFGIEPEQMHQQLEWARFDLETNKRRETIKKDVINWFYDRLMITGGIYPRSANYRTDEELRAEALQHQHESDLAAQAKIVELEFENSFRAFLANPEAPLYQELLERVNSFALEQLKTGEGRAEEIGLDALFKMHWGATANDPASSTVSFALSELGTGQADKPIALVNGWNLVGYDALYPQPVIHAISSIATLIESIWGWNSGQWLSYVPNRPANSLTSLEPGMGYWIKMKQPATWTLP
jgi:hypothetical protein